MCANVLTFGEAEVPSDLHDYVRGPARHKRGMDSGMDSPYVFPHLQNDLVERLPLAEFAANHT
jgi:hypothetical protein